MSHYVDTLVILVYSSIHTTLESSIKKNRYKNVDTFF